MSWLLVFGVDAPTRLPGGLPNRAAPDLAGNLRGQTGKDWATTTQRPMKCRKNKTALPGQTPVNES